LGFIAVKALFTCIAVNVDGISICFHTKLRVFEASTILSGRTCFALTGLLV
jgi:hypothetical protein